MCLLYSFFTKKKKKKKLLFKYAHEKRLKPYLLVQGFCLSINAIFVSLHDLTG